MRSTLGQTLSRLTAAGEDFRSMELDTVRIIRVDILGQRVQSLSNAVGLHFVNGNASKDPVLLSRVAGGASIVKVQKVHCSGAACGQTKRRSAARLAVN